MFKGNSSTNNQTISNNRPEVVYAPVEDENINILFSPPCGATKPDTIFLYLTIITGILLMLVGATSWGWASPAIIKLKSNNTDENPLGRPITTVEISMLVGVPSLTSLFGCLVLPKLADTVGRKRSLQIFALGMFLSIIGLSFSSAIYVMIIFASTLANAFAGVWSVLPIYLTEICEDHNRTKFGCLMSVCIPLGLLYCYIFGPPFSVRVFTLITTAPLIPFFIFFPFSPESPVYLLSKGKINLCRKALKKLRGNKSSEEVEVDMEKIKHSIQITLNSKKHIGAIFNTKESRIGLVLALLPILIQNFSGVPVLMTLLAPIFDGTGNFISGDTAAIIVGTVKATTFTITSLFIEKTGRKPMLILSSVGSGISALITGLYFYLKYVHSPLMSQLEWLPLLSILIYVIFYSVGLGPIPQCLPSELFLSNIRSSAVSVISFFNYMFLALVLFSYPLLAEAVGDHVCFWIFSASSLIGSFLFYRFLPETRGKSFLEIQEILKSY